jgi:two-component system, cell cycle sensor histidine kinase and response regulator CckA
VPRPFLSGLRDRLLLLVFLAVLPAFALTWYAGAENRQRRRDVVASDTVVLARILANDQERIIDGTRQILSELAQEPEAQAGDPRRLRTVFVVLKKINPGYSSFALLDASGNVVVALPAAEGPVNFSDRPWFQRAVTTKGFAVGDFQVGQLSGKRVIVGAQAVLDVEGRVVSVLAAGVDVTWLNQVAATAQLPPGAALFLVDRNGVVLARYPETAGVLGQGLGERGLLPVMRGAAEGTFEIAGDDGESRIYAFTALRGPVETGLRLAVGIPRDVAYGPMDKQRTRNLIALALAMVLTLGAASFAAERFVLRRVKSLIDATRRLAAGDVAARTRMPYDHGELSDLARAFDEMASALHAREEERAAAEQELRHSEERFRAFMDNSPALAVIRTPAGEAVYANAAFERGFGLAPGAWKGRGPEAFWDADTATRFRDEDARVVDAGAVRQSVGPVTLAGGATRHWLSVAFPVTSSDGQRLAGSMALDLTEWREAQEALARAERRHTQLFDQAWDAVVVTDESLRLTEVNSAMCRLTGYSRDELLRRRVPDLIDPEQLHAHPIRIEALRAGEAVIADRQIRRKDGTVVHVEVSARSFEGGGVQAIVRDVTRRHEAEQAIRESEERFRLLYQYLPLAYQSLSENGTLVTVNDAWLMLTGYRRGQVIGRRFSDFLAPESVEAYESRFWRGIRHADIRDVELSVVRGDRSTLTVLLDGRRGRDEHGESRIHCALHDVTAVRLADARLRASEERYRTLFAESPVSLWEEDFSGIRRHLGRLKALGVSDFEEHFRANPDELADCVESVRVVDVNRATLALYGAESRSQLLAGLDRIIGEDGRDVFLQSIVALGRGDRSWNSEGTNYTLHGEPIRLALQWSVAPGAEDTWARVLVSATDITHRTRVEDALRESEARFERVFRSSPSIMGISRRSDGVYLDVNDVFLREFGFRREEVIGRTATDLGLWLSPASRSDMLGMLEEHGAFYHEDVRLRRRSGGLLEGSFSAVPLTVDGIDCLLVQVVDTTARRRAEQAGRESQRMLETLMSNLPGMAYQCCLDPEWTMLFVSEGCRELTGLLPGDLVGNRTVSYGRLIVEEDRELVDGGVRAAVAAGEPYRLTYRIRHADGTIRWVWEQGRVAQSAAEDAVTLEGFISDITDRKRAEEDLKQSSEQLRQAQKMEAVGRLAGGIAHDFNNLLTAILGYSDLILQRLPVGDPLVSRVEEIRRAGERAANLTRKLLAFSRKQVLAPRVLSIDTVLDDMAPMLRRLIGEDVELRLHAGTAGNVKADPTQIEQVVMNLVVNARDAMPRGGRLTIETSARRVEDREAADHGVASGPYAVFSVTDTGVGMDEATLARLFEPFFTTKSPGQGTGLGLSTVYGIVQQSGGFVVVESKPGEGAAFRVCLPQVQECVEEARCVPPPVEAVGSETILLVEDEDAVRSLVVAILERLGYSVVEARDGQEAFEIWQREGGRFHLVVTDIVMPRMDGPALVASVRETHPDTPFIYLSGYTDDAVVRRSASVDHDTPLLQKPFTPGTLARLVRAGLDRRSADSAPR